ncbi:hypothetical protein [uncultured Nitratireductor sp.]|uniref:hypothetical protein n=1 Tax=uncultured Nitratireductor sp. TaxID=520953 RepID=UPI0025F5D38F|nr:hypothetical protein [uncultured Nitratireductor sp.]
MFVAVTRGTSEIVAIAERKSWFTSGDDGDDNAAFDAVADSHATIEVYPIPFEAFASGAAFLGGTYRNTGGSAPVAYLAWKTAA